VAVFTAATAMPPFLSQMMFAPRLRRWRYGGAWLAYGAILVMGSVPGARAELGNYASGIVLHTLAYGAITFLLHTGSGGSLRARSCKAVMTVVAMGALDELVQSFLPYRRGALSDWLVDCNAAVITAGLLWQFLPRSSDVD
jgi:hypothetical protein